MVRLQRIILQTLDIVKQKNADCIIQQFWLKSVHSNGFYSPDSRDFHGRRPNSKPRIIAIIENQLNP
jgi:hypothetical protein